MTDGLSGSYEPKRIDRNWVELLQELRVAQTGVQILTGFLLTLPFTPRFGDLPDRSVAGYTVSLCSAMAAAFLLMTPVALHRAVFRKRRRPWLVQQAHRVSRAGLGLLAVANIAGLWVVLDVVGPLWAATLAAGVFTAGVLGLWIALPWWERRTGDPASP